MNSLFLIFRCKIILINLNELKKLNSSKKSVCFYNFTWMKLFFENISQSERIPVEQPLEAAFEQALDVFELLPEDDGSSFGLITDRNVVIQISKYNRFMWLVEIPEPEKNGSWQAICNRNRVKRALKELFEEKDPFLVCDFKFESFH